MGTIRTIDENTSAARSIPAGARLLALLMAVIARLETMMERSRGRRALSALSDEQLKDIGLSRSQAFSEASRPFWK